ncbi:MAG TPA: hypothetical protein VET48_07405, partial [Steroidobacteraceae bacterium]|nr:hypothetical protein [Steroidobacteraceae bacterium]
YEALESSYLNLQRNGGSTTTGSAELKDSASDKPPQGNYSTGFVNMPVPAGESRRDRMWSMGPRQDGSMQMIRHLKLTEAEAKKLMQVLTENQEKFRQVFAASNGAPPDPQMLEALRAEEDQNIRNALGENKYQDYEDYRKNMAEHQQIDRLNIRLANANEGTLLPQQEDQLLAAMKEERSRIPAPTQSDYGSRADFMAAYQQWREGYTTRTLTRAETILTPDQLNTFKNMRTPPFAGSPRNIQSGIRPANPT